MISNEMQHFVSYRLNLLQVQISKRLKLKLIVTLKILFALNNK